MSEKKNYWAVEDGFIDGTWRNARELVLMTTAQARYHLLDGRLSDVAPVQALARLEKKNGAAGGNEPKDGKTAD